MLCRYYFYHWKEIHLSIHLGGKWMQKGNYVVSSVSKYRDSSLCIAKFKLSFPPHHLGAEVIQTNVEYLLSLVTLITTTTIMYVTKACFFFNKANLKRQREGVEGMMKVMKCVP
jgi:hypothetical protein